MRIKRLYKPENFTVRQLYMFMDYGRLERGYCTEITETYVEFEYKGHVFKLAYKYGYKDEPNYFAEYNSGIFNKWYKLREVHKQEMQELLEENIYTRDKCIRNKNTVGSIFLALLSGLKRVIKRYIG